MASLSEVMPLTHENPKNSHQHPKMIPVIVVTIYSMRIIDY